MLPFLDGCPRHACACHMAGPSCACAGCAAGQPCTHIHTGAGLTPPRSLHATGTEDAEAAPTVVPAAVAATPAAKAAVVEAPIEEEAAPVEEEQPDAPSEYHDAGLAQRDEQSGQYRWQSGQSSNSRAGTSAGKQHGQSGQAGHAAHRLACKCCLKSHGCIPLHFILCCQPLRPLLTLGVNTPCTSQGRC